MAAPDLSILTVTHDRWGMLERKVAALCAQTLAPARFEWVVLTNACTDGTPEFLKRASLPFHLTLLHADTLLSAAQARNRCAAAARGRVLYLSDDDCLPAPETLARHLEAQERDCVALGGLEFVHEGAREAWSPRRVRYWQLNGANTSLPASEFHRVGGFEETLSGYGGEDVLLGYRLRSLHYVSLPDARATHLGPNPLRSANADKARAAGTNAMRIASQYPELAFRLGVSPTLLALKRVLLRKNLLGRVLSPAAYTYERAYLRGAMEERNRDRTS